MRPRRASNGEGLPLSPPAGRAAQQRRVSLLFRDAAHLIAQRAGARVQGITQPREIVQRPYPPQAAAAPRELETVDDPRLRHRVGDGIIVKNLCQNKAMPSPRRLVLASSSKYRRALLERLGLPFACADPALDEARVPGESGATTALRLAAAKARAVAARFPGAIIIGSDQVATCEGRRLEKPGTHRNALAQLGALSGKTASFDTAVAVLDAASGRLLARAVPCLVTFRDLSSAQVEAYLQREQPYDCAGSAKAEGLGIALIARIETEDPTSLVGLPLIALCELLAEAGLPVLGQ